MKNKVMKRAIAAVMAFAVSGGAVVADSAYLFGSTSVVKAETIEQIDNDGYDHENDPDHLDNFDPASLSDKTGVLLLNGKVNKEDVQKYKDNEKVTKVSCAKGTVFPEDCSAMFDSFNVKSIDLSNADTSKVTNMSNMFAACRKLESLDLSGVDTSNVWNMSHLFNACSVKELDLSNFDTSNVQTMKAMFGLSDVQSLDLKNFDTSNVRDMSFMFDGCEFTSLDLSSFDTSNVQVMARMFYCCRNMESIDLSSFDTSNVRDMSYMFSETNFVSLDLSNWDTSKVVDMSYMFWCARKLKSLDLKHFDTSNVTTMEFMFCECNAIESLDISNFDTAKVVSMKEMFYECNNLESLDLSSFNTSNVKNMYYMFGCCNKLSSIDLTGIDTSNTEILTGSFHMLFDCTALEKDIVHVYGKNITLDGSLGVNFYIYEPKYLGSNASLNLAKIVMSGPNGDIPITDFSRKTEDNPNGVDISYGKMKLTYPVNATQANEKISLKAYDENGKQLIVCNTNGYNYQYSLSSYSQAECSVQSYINTLKRDNSYKNNAKLQKLVDALENYCKAADKYFNGTENEVIKYSEEYKAVFNKYDPKLPDDVKLSLVLNSETALRIYTDSSNVLIGGVKAEAKSKNGKQYYEIPNIAAHRLSTPYEITIDGEKYDCSALSYAYRVINNNADSVLKDVAWALYIYSMAANAYPDAEQDVIAPF